MPITTSVTVSSSSSSFGGGSFDLFEPYSLSPCAIVLADGSGLGSRVNPSDGYSVTSAPLFSSLQTNIVGSGRESGRGSVQQHHQQQRYSQSKYQQQPPRQQSVYQYQQLHYQQPPRHVPEQQYQKQSPHHVQRQYQTQLQQQHQQHQQHQQQYDSLSPQMQVHSIHFDPSDTRHPNPNPNPDDASSFLSHRFFDFPSPVQEGSFLSNIEHNIIQPNVQPVVQSVVHPSHGIYVRESPSPAQIYTTAYAQQREASGSDAKLYHASTVADAVPFDISQFLAD
eukprot:GILJ01001984.1.p1 GENE.GILJ01001984.1~~GILJ01001984.1.p1  ORF type:complete len:281 (-),score=47.23 GILJ01001984.1:395-1237(-)